MERYKFHLFYLCACLVSIFCGTDILEQSECKFDQENGKFHRFSYPVLERRKNITFDKYKGHVTIVVNVASF